MALAGFALAGCGTQSPGTVRYRVLVEVTTPAGPRTGSSVVESTIAPSLRTGQSGGVSYKVRGEAVAVDLGAGRTVFALLSGRDAPVPDYHGRLLHSALQHGARPNPPMPRRFRPHEWREERETARTLKPTFELPVQAYPKFVRFLTPGDPKSVQVIDPSSGFNLDTGMARIARVVISVTDDPVSSEIKPLVPPFDDSTGYSQWYKTLQFDDPRRIGPEDFRQGLDR